MTEQWKSIDGYPDYEVSDLGRVRRVVSRGAAKAGSVLKSHCKPGTQYQIVGLVHNGRRKPFTIHRLVADAFLGPLPQGMDRSHIDGDPTNNAASNLRFESKADNNRRKWQHGTAQTEHRNPNAKLTEHERQEIVQAITRGEQQKSVAARYGVARETIRRVMLKASTEIRPSIEAAPGGRSFAAPQEPETYDGLEPL